MADSLETFYPWYACFVRRVVYSHNEELALLCVEHKKPALHDACPGLSRKDRGELLNDGPFDCPEDEFIRNLKAFFLFHCDIGDQNMVFFIKKKKKNFHPPDNIY